MILEIAGLFIMLAGFVVGLGAVTVIDMIGFRGIRSSYWTETATRAHKVTKQHIWIGVVLAIVGAIIFYSQIGFVWEAQIQAVLAVFLVLNGIFLSFVVSPYLIERERQGHSAELLPRKLQMQIAGSFVVSFVGWWASLFLLVWLIVPLL